MIYKEWTLDIFIPYQYPVLTDTYKKQNKTKTLYNKLQTLSYKKKKKNNKKQKQYSMLQTINKTI